MICRCDHLDDLPIRTASLAFARVLPCAEFSELPRSGSYGSSGGGKNPLWDLRQGHRTSYDHKVRWIRDLPCGDTRIYLEVTIRRVFCPSCGKVKQEKLPWVAANPFYTKRFVLCVGRRCRASTLQDVAKERALDWKTVKELDKQYMREQLRRAGTPRPQVLGIDEVAIKKGHTYRIVVSDLVRRRPIWFGGKDRSEKSMDEFYQWLGPKKSGHIRLAVMDMWRAFRSATMSFAEMDGTV